MAKIKMWNGHNWVEMAQQDTVDKKIELSVDESIEQALFENEAGKIIIKK